MPAFPENTALWSDGSNWQTGHWVNGRLGAATAADVIAAVLADHGFQGGDVARVSGDLGGYVQSEQASARDVLEPLMAALQIDAVEDGAKLRFRSRMKQASQPRDIAVLADLDGQALIEETRGHDSDFGGEAILDRFDPENAFERTTARSRRVSPANERVLRLALPGVMHDGAAASAVEDALRDHQVSRRSVRFSLSPAALAVEPGDVVTFADGPAGGFIVGRIEDGAARSVEARAFVPSSGGRPVQPSKPIVPPRRPSDGFSPVVHLMDLPQYEAGNASSFARGAVFARPWRVVTLSSSATTEGYQARVRLGQPAQTGVLAGPLGAGVTGRFDALHALTLNLHFGGLSSAGRLAVLNGRNRVAILASNGVWEIIGFQSAEEISAGRWRLTKLLRGLHGTTDAMLAGSASGAPVVVLNAAVRPLALSADEAGRVINWIAEASGQAATPGGPLPLPVACGPRGRLRRCICVGGALKVAVSESPGPGARAGMPTTGLMAILRWMSLWNGIVSIFSRGQTSSGPSTCPNRCCITPPASRSRISARRRKPCRFAFGSAVRRLPSACRRRRCSVCNAKAFPFKPNSDQANPTRSVK